MCLGEGLERKNKINKQTTNTRTALRSVVCYEVHVAPAEVKTIAALIYSYFRVTPCPVRVSQLVGYDKVKARLTIV